jgi:DNA-binding transcriptional regulator PaaX
MQVHVFYVARSSAFWQDLRMHAKTEELLYLLLWTCEVLLHPTFRNMTDSFEGWAYRNGFHRQLADLERRLFLESVSPPGTNRRSPERIVRLTESGRLHALGGRDPVVWWNRAWDGQWRLALYDVPKVEGHRRNRVRDALRANGFGWLQQSVWVSPHPLPEQGTLLAGAPIDVESLILLEARPCGGETDRQIVSGAWDFDELNQLYADELKVLDRFPDRWSGTEPEARRLRQWIEAERAAWLEAVRWDPLLPGCLLPEGYLGQKVWDKRLKILSRAGERMRMFHQGPGTT